MIFDETARPRRKGTAVKSNKKVEPFPMNKRQLLAVAALVLSLAGTGLPAQQNETHLLNFQNADIRSLITTVADITGRNIVIDPAVSGQITVISSEELTAESVYDVFLSILAVHGYSAIDDGAVTRIVPDAAARFGSGVANGPTGGQDQVTRLIPLEHVRAAEVLPMRPPRCPHPPPRPPNAGPISLLVSAGAPGPRRLRAFTER